MNQRTLLTFVAWFAAVSLGVADDRDAIRALEGAGAIIQRDETQKDKPLVGVVYNLRQVTDDGNRALKELEELPAIEFVGSGDTELTAATLRALQGKRSLKRLAISYAKISDPNARILGSLKSLEALEFRVQVEMSLTAVNEIFFLTDLRELTIADRLVDDAVLEDLGKFPELRVLNVKSVFVTDEGLVYLKRAKNLRTLRIFAGANVTADGLRQLADLPLKSLEITCADLNEAKLKELGKLKPLRVLSVVNAKTCTDAAVPYLSELSELQELEIVGSKLSKEGLKDLKKALPNCKIKTGAVDQ